jgi:rod shape-determining protein MreC
MNTGGLNRPQKKRYMRRGIAGGLLFVSLLMLLADKQQNELLSSGRLSVDDTSSKIMGFLAAPLRGIEMIFISIGDRSSAYQQNKRLKTEVDRLHDVEHKVLELELRLKIYEDLLEMNNGANQEIDRIVARTVSETNGPFVHSALINIGSDNNVKTGQAVATSEGLIGHVVRTGKSSARVLLLNDLNSHISVMSQRSQSRAIMIGANNTKPKLDYISRQGDWEPGDRVVTSGDEGILPSGIKIGIAEAIDPEHLVVKLNSSAKPIDWVWVYLFDPIIPPPHTEPEPSVEISGAVSDTDGLQ